MLLLIRLYVVDFLETNADLNPSDSLMEIFHFKPRLCCHLMVVYKEVGSKDC